MINSDDEDKSNDGDTTAPGGKNKLEGKKKRRVEARDAIQALRKMSVGDGPGKVNESHVTGGSV